MRKSAVFASLLLSLAVATGCHNSGDTPPDGGDPTATPTPTDNSRFQFCADGTLNCYVTFPEGGETINTYNNYYSYYNFSQTFEQCIVKCMPANCTNGGGDIVEEASTECPTEFEACEGQCNILSQESPLQNIPDSDELVIPENPKVVVVEITACFDWNTTEELHFQGPNVYFHRENSGRRKVQKETDGKNYKYVDFRYSVGLSKGCPDELKKKIQVTYQPLGSSSLVLGKDTNTKTIAITPFENTLTVERTYKIPHSIPFGIPSSIREEIDLTEVAWVPKEFGAITPDSFQHGIHRDDVTAINDFRFFANDLPYGQSVIFLSYLGRGNPRPKQTITMYGFFKGKSE